jgi:hypothetical protein
LSGTGRDIGYLQVCWGCLLQFAYGTKIVWEIRIDQRFLEGVKVFNFPTAVKEEDFLGDVLDFLN